MDDESVEFRILGPLEVLRAGTALPLGGPRHRALLAVLLVHAGEPVTADRLIDVLWGEAPPRSAAAMLHVRVSELRKALRAGRSGRDVGLVTRGSGYLLRAAADALDAHRFEQLATAGRHALSTGAYRDASARLREALGLWRGPVLAEVADQPFARAYVARLESLRMQAIEDRLAADLALGRHVELIAELRALVTDQPLRERPWCQLILALYRTGRQSEALEAYAAARGALADRLGIDPGAELQQLHTAVLRQDPALDLGTASRINTETPAQPDPPKPGRRLPTPLTSFVGREWELAEVRALLQQNRLVTLTGVGGVGKSRLAVEAATLWQADHGDASWLVELAPLTQPGLVAHAVAAALGVREHPKRPVIDLVAQKLGTDAALVVLDNCEHLVAEVAALAHGLLEACPQLKILATSRARLGITGEVLRPVAGLAVPLAGTRTAAAAGRAEAVVLLVERAAAVQPGLQLTDATAADVAHICRSLDGLPLAIELAAAQSNVLDFEQIAARLDDRFRLLNRGSRTALTRHQTLKALIDWSYELLSPPERRLFDRLAVFVGGFTLHAAETVCADDDGPGVDELVARLVDTSLLVAESTPAGGRRFRMLETLRVYARQRLAERGETARFADRHAAYFLAFVEPAGAALRSRKQPAWLRRLATEHSNLRASLEHSLDSGDAETALRLAGSLYPFWNLRGHYTEGRRWLSRALDTPGPSSPAARAQALLGAATLAVVQGDLAQATSSSRQAAVLCEQADDQAGLAHALQHLGYGAILAGDLDQACALLEHSLRSARAVEHHWLMGWSLVFLATAALAGDRYDKAATLAAQSYTVLGPNGDPEGRAWALSIQAAAWRTDDPARAGQLLREGLHAFQGLGGLWGLSLGLFVAAQLAGARGNHARLATLVAASEATRRSIGAALLPFVKVWRDAAVAAATEALGRDTFDGAWRAGHALTPDTAVAEAFRELDRPSNPKAAVG